MRSVFRTAAIILVTLWATLPISPAMAGAAEEEAFAAFEWFCLAHLNKPNQLSFLFEGLEIKPLPDDKSKMFLYPKKGKAWLLPGEHTSLMVSQTTDDVCTVYGRNVVGSQTQQVFEKSVRSRKLRTEDMGSQIQEFYAVTFPDPGGGHDIHALVLITTSKLDSIEGVFLIAMPESLARREGISIPEWP